MRSAEIPPMNMADFFNKSRGLWLNRRVVHHMDYQDDESADSNLVIEPFDSSDPAVAKVCASLQVDLNIFKFFCTFCGLFPTLEDFINWFYF